MLGIVAKLRVPYAHTSLEIIRMRYGKYAHFLFILLNLINNIFGCGSMILAGAQLVTGMTGMHVIAACTLIPAGGKFAANRRGGQTLIFIVVIYTAVGGLKATFLTDFLHTTVALILLIYFSLAVLTNEHIGGLSGLYYKVKATNDYIPGNYKGSLLTMKSKSCKISTYHLSDLTNVTWCSCSFRSGIEIWQSCPCGYGYSLLAEVFRF